MKFLAAILSFSTVFGTVYFKESFNNGLSDKWVLSKSKDDFGKFVVSNGKFFADEASSKGLQTSQDGKFYAMSIPFDNEFDNAGKVMVIQFSVKHEQEIDCGGGYVKILPPGYDATNLNGDSKYNIMFGPDICGGDKKTHVIFSYKDKNYELNPRMILQAESDKLTHLYTLILNPDQTYSVLIDEKEVQKGDLISDYDMLPPSEINDPKASKPKDWVGKTAFLIVDDEMMVDPKDEKPAGYDDIPSSIVDPNAEKPEDWDDDMDGDWEAPKIPNPDYKGEWKPIMIKNPDYKGIWKHPQIPNPDFKHDSNIYKYKSSGLFFDLWQVKSGTIFDDIIVTDSVEEAQAFAKETFSKKKDAEAEALKAYEAKIEAEEKAKMEKEKAEMEKKKAEAPPESDEDEDPEKDDEDAHDEL